MMLLICLLTMIYIFVFMIKLSGIKYYGELTTKDVWLCIGWPFTFGYAFLKCSFYIILELANEFLYIGLLAFGFKYRNTKMYKSINNLLIQYEQYQTIQMPNSRNPKGY